MAARPCRHAFGELARTIYVDADSRPGSGAARSDSANRALTGLAGFRSARSPVNRASSR